MHELTIIVAKYFIGLSIIATIALLVEVALRRGKREIYIVVARLILGGIIALIIAYIARKLYNDPRPFVVGHFKPWISHAADNGFVSDHTLLASFLAFTCYFYKKWVGVALLGLAVGIGAARVAAGVHHWADIGSAIGISLVSALLALYIVSLFTKKPVPIKPKSH